MTVVSLWCDLDHHRSARTMTRALQRCRATFKQCHARTVLEANQFPQGTTRISGARSLAAVQTHEEGHSDKSPGWFRYEMVLARSHPRAKGAFTVDLECSEFQPRQCSPHDNTSPLPSGRCTRLPFFLGRCLRRS